MLIEQKWLLYKFIKEAYILGLNNENNPYFEHTNEWFSFNKGYNEK